MVFGTPSCDRANVALDLPARRSSELRVELGSIYAEHLDERERAIECFEEAIKLDEDNAGAARPLVADYVERQRYAQAEPEFRKAAALAPTDAAYQSNVGDACRLQKSRLQRRAKRRIAFNYKRSMSIAARFPPGDCPRINPMLITKNRIGDSECFIAFKQQWINKRNGGPDAAHLALAQMLFNAFEIGTGNPCHAIVLSVTAER